MTAGGPTPFSLWRFSCLCPPVSFQLSALKQELLSEGYMEADEQIRLFNNNKMPLKPGCDPIQVHGQHSLGVVYTSQVVWLLPGVRRPA